MIYSSEIMGGLLIGFASAVPLLYEGRIAGVSGYLAAGLRPQNSEGKAGLLFMLGLVLGGFVWRLLGGDLPSGDSLNLNLGLWLAAGLLIGFGARLGGGCTSGHGVCGLGRASPRSFASVLIFMSFAILVSFLMRSFL